MFLLALQLFSVSLGFSSKFSTASKNSANMSAVGDANPSLDTQQALKRVVRSALVVGGVARGLHESAKVLDKREALVCLYAKECDEENYEKLVRALCKAHDIPVITVETKAELGEIVGQCKYDKEGKARKVVGCSCAVIKDFGRGDEESRRVLGL
ncbi:Ribosomal L7Ae/L30e/S12e/Gadd45 family protein [Aphelenchoides bicaudatus]|nr:Ribosomal L7Ae/L30e/S12e/Gadd45 family protein [Aphelenchoides bicaudatus]